MKSWRRTPSSRVHKGGGASPSGRWAPAYCTAGEHTTDCNVVTPAVNLKSDLHWGNTSWGGEETSKSDLGLLFEIQYLTYYLISDKLSEIRLAVRNPISDELSDIRFTIRYPSSTCQIRSRIRKIRPTIRYPKPTL